MATLTGPFDVPQKPGDTVRLGQAAVKIYRGGAVAVILGTGYATPLVVATDGHQFQGVAMETKDNSAGTAGGAYISIAPTGIFAFNMSGITVTSVGKPVWFSDDNTVTTTPGAVLAGRVVAIDSGNSLCWVRIDEATKTAVPSTMTNISASGAINPRTPSRNMITKAGVAAMTLAAPTATTDDGVEIWLTSSTANAHTLTATGLFQCGTASVNLATFAAQAGAGLCVVAFNGKWVVKYANGITFS